MTTAPLIYWKPGSEERRLRIFISHRFGHDESLYNEVISSLNRSGFSVQDMSLAEWQIITGPRGGARPRLEVQAEIAARIYTSDVMIAPSAAGVSRSRWVTWEVELAAVGYGIPILFVNKRNQTLNTSLVKQVAALGLPFAACDPEAHEIAYNVAKLVDGRPYWAMRQEETDQTIRFRGPPRSARDDVLRTFPFQPRLVDPDPLPPPPKRGFWGFFSGRDP